MRGKSREIVVVVVVVLLPVADDIIRSALQQTKRSVATCVVAKHLFLSCMKPSWGLEVSGWRQW